MMSEQTLTFLWQGGLGAIPVIALVILLTRLLPLRPATRHLLWATALLSLLAAPLAARWLPTPSLTPSPSTSAPAAVSDAAPPASLALREQPPENQADADSAAPQPATVAPIPWLREPAYVSPFAPTPELRIPSRLRVDGLTPPPSASRAARAERRATTAQRNVESAQRRSRSSAGADRALGAQPALPLTSAPPDLAQLNLPQAPVVAPLLPLPAARSAAPAPQPAQADKSLTSAVALWLDAQAAAIGQWRDRLFALTAGIRSAPPVPAVLWLGGSLIVLVVFGWRTWRGSRWLQATAAAPPQMARRTQRVADRLGLSRAPETRITDLRVSPFIWCARKPKLIIPTALWDELDEPGRDAILHHELAHLKRRDHLLRWADLAAGVAYWWHPLVWLIRKRLRDEADLCCDAWVTALLPSHRREYAQALVRTKAFLSTAPSAPTAIGLESASSGAKRFARRITMVMLHRTRPGASVAGLLLALSVGVIGLASAPIFASPPADEAAAHPHEEAEKTKEEKSKAESKKTEQKEEAESSNETTFEKYLEETERKESAEKAKAQAEREKARAKAQAEREKVRAKAQAEREKARAKARAEREKARAKALAERAKRRVEVEVEIERSQCPAQRARAPQVRVEIERNMAQAERRLAEMHRRLENAMRDRERFARELQGRVRAFARDCDCDCDDDHDHADHDEAHAHGGIGGGSAVAPAPPAGEPFERTYELSGDKLERLGALMALDSVPTLVRLHDDGITVIGTPAEHRIFGAFVRFLDGEFGGGSAQAPRAPRAPRGPRAMRVPAPPAPAQIDAIRRGQRAVGEAAQAMRRRAQAIAEEAQRMAGQRERIVERVEQAQRMRERIEREVERIQEQAKQAWDRAEEVQKKAKEIQEQSETQAGARRAQQLRERIAAEVERLRARAAELRARAEELKARAEQIDDEQDALEDEGDALEDRAAELQDRARELAERLQERLEDIEEAIEERIESMREAAEEAGAEQLELDEALRQAIAQSMGEISQALADIADEIQDDIADAVADLRDDDAASDADEDADEDDSAEVAANTRA